MPRLGSGVTMVEVANVLGYYSNPILLSKLVKHPNIIKWSRCKPIQNASVRPDTVAELQTFMDNSNWGFDMKKVEFMNTDEEMFGSAITLSKQDVWQYSGMTPSQDYAAHLGDFRAYNSDAVCPFIAVENSYNVPGVAGKKGPVIELSWLKNTDPNVDINAYDYSLFRNKPVYIIYRKVGETLANSAATKTYSTGFTGMTTGWMQWTSAQTGTYETCAVIYRDNAGEMYPLPETYATFNVRNMTQEEYCGLQVTNMCSMAVSGGKPKLNVKFAVRNITNDPITAVTSCWIYDSHSTPEALFPYITANFNVPANSQLYIYGDENGQLTTTDPGVITIDENISYYTLPIMSQVSARNSIIGDSTIEKTKTIYTA